MFALYSASASASHAPFHSTASGVEAVVSTAHAYTARMCAASRWEESQRPDSLFYDPLSYKLAGEEGRRSPMGSWIMVPRTRFGDDLLREMYARGCRQLVMLGAGMDSRAYRMAGLGELHVFEVDQQTIFDVKEPLLAHEPLAVRRRHVVGTEFTERGRWVTDLEGSGFDRNAPTLWLLEGLLMYLSHDDTLALIQDVGAVSAPGSAVFHDAVSANYLSQNINVGGAPFIGGSDDYGGLWRDHGGFELSVARDFGAVSVNRAQRRIEVNQHVPEASERVCRGRNVILFVVAEKKTLA